MDKTLRELAGATKQDVSDGLENTIGGHCSAGTNMASQLDPLIEKMHKCRDE